MDSSRHPECLRNEAENCALGDRNSLPLGSHLLLALLTGSHTRYDFEVEAVTAGAELSTRKPCRDGTNGGSVFAWQAPNPAS